MCARWWGCSCGRTRPEASAGKRGLFAGVTFLHNLESCRGPCGRSPSPSGLRCRAGNSARKPAAFGVGAALAGDGLRSGPKVSNQSQSVRMVSPALGLLRSPSPASAAPTETASTQRVTICSMRAALAANTGKAGAIHHVSFFAGKTLPQAQRGLQRRHSACRNASVNHRAGNQHTYLTVLPVSNQASS
ncbi:hypothetical protein D3C81_1600530 [compost metagenome]